MTKKVKTFKVTDISFRKVDNGQMRVHKPYQAHGAIIGGNLLAVGYKMKKLEIN